MFIGIDNGINGGIVVIDVHGKVVEKYIIPTEKVQSTARHKRTKINTAKLVVMLWDIYKQYKIKHTYLEKPVIMTINGNMSIASTWYTFGLYEGILRGLKREFTVINVRDWQKYIGKRPKQDSKLISLQYAIKNSGVTSDWFLKSTRCSNVHDGFTDAYCIADYGRHLFGL